MMELMDAAKKSIRKSLFKYNVVSKDRIAKCNTTQLENKNYITTMNTYLNQVNIFLDTCKCKDHLLDERNEGDCQDYFRVGRKDVFVFENRNSGKRWCYVSQPSDCIDLVDSTIYDRHQWSHQACDQTPGIFYWSFYVNHAINATDDINQF